MKLTADFACKLDILITREFNSFARRFLWSVIYLTARVPSEAIGMLIRKYRKGIVKKME